MVNPYRAVSSLLGTRANPPAGALPAPAVRDDPLSWQRPAAIWAAVIGGLLAVLLLVARPIMALAADATGARADAPTRQLPAERRTAARCRRLRPPTPDTERLRAGSNRTGAARRMPQLHTLELLISVVR